MAKFEEAYSIECGKVINAEKAYELYWDGIINNKRAFECTDPNCEAQITCVNIDKKRAEMKQTPHFKCYGEHSEECEVIKEFKEIEDNRKRGKRKRTIGYIDNKIDIFSFDRPKRDSMTVKVSGETDKDSKRENKERIKKEYENKGSRNTTYYSIKPLISKFEKYNTEGSMTKHYINIKKARISYNTMFVDIENKDFLGIDKYYRIYYGVGKIYRTKKNEKSFVVFLSDGFKDESTKTVIYINDKTIDKHYRKNKWREELDYLVQERNRKIIFYVYCKPEKHDKFITLPLFNMDCIDYRIIGEEN
ncbi:hypothetical protein [Clostridium botulinum]|uniref:hypothetical protein n=1 Tax=Clostridium botulinum TaxID=1491 RepID=UPI001967FFD6|nr:hypothetical protein [Clostridium botulinum]MBN1078071.1 hypothetical protein [Clostridium botulinum]